MLTNWSQRPAARRCELAIGPNGSRNRPVGTNLLPEANIEPSRSHVTGFPSARCREYPLTPRRIPRRRRPQSPIGAAKVDCHQVMSSLSANQVAARLPVKLGTVLCLHEPWSAKPPPRAWLAPGQPPLQTATTRGLRGKAHSQRLRAHRPHRLALDEHGRLHRWPRLSKPKSNTRRELP